MRWTVLSNAQEWQPTVAPAVVMIKLLFIIYSLASDIIFYTTTKQQLANQK